MQNYATELVSIITTALSNFLGALGAPIIDFFEDLFVVDPSGTPTPSVIAYVALTFLGIRIAYKFIPTVLKLLKVRR
jgi:xanthosine utilization system XapX-like protein